MQKPYRNKLHLGLESILFTGSQTSMEMYFDVTVLNFFSFYFCSMNMYVSMICVHLK